MGVRAGLESGASALRWAARLVDDLAEQLQRAQRLIRGAWAEEIEAAEKDVQAAQSALVDERFKVETFGNPLAAAFQKASLRHLLGGKGLPFSAWPPIRTVMAWI
jgi:hypothetical protein